MRAARWGGLAALVILGNACTPRVAADRGVFGAPIRATAEGISQPLFGELLAVDRDTVWIRVGESLQHVMLSNVASVHIERGKRGMRHGLLRGVAFGVVTGLAMSAACNSVGEANDCSSVLHVSVVASTLVGFLAGVDNESDRYLRLERPTSPALVTWARYPQGLPILIREAPRILDPTAKP